ncbi:MAG: xanthine dehydrogenase family protein molybdopterin-binding subunit [Chloroflexi bacterium]|nr:xanthine dehydrogenase family protein molybdopterin-binding subunit [Chloroflexota bacterium]
MGAKYFGASVPRREDPRFLAGAGRYLDDLQLPGLLHAAFLRSPHGHARIHAIRAGRARQLAGVYGVFTFETLARWMRPLPTFGTPPPALAEQVEFRLKPTPQHPLCQDTARYVGEIVAVVVAESRALAEDALDAIEVEYEPRPAVVDMVAAGEPGAPLLYPEWGDNVALAFTLAVGDPDGAFRAAEVVVSERFRIQRYVGMPLEPRGAIASYDRRDGTLTTWNSTQVPHFVQQHLANVFGVAVHKIRVIAPDIGGGFGTKASGYAEDVLVPLVARELGRPVKWVEDRREHFGAAAHARAQVHDIALAARRDGTILGLRDQIWADLGAYNPWGIVNPFNTVAHLRGPHHIPHMSVEVKGVVTNKTPNAPYRGAGRPETVFAMDRIIDRLARELGMDPVEVRRRNYLHGEQLPYDAGMLYRDGQPLVYDSGDYAEALERALDAAGFDGFRAEQARLRTHGIYRGLGVSGYVEGTGLGPFESATVRLDISGHVVVTTGACCQGQGHETTFAQLAADALDVPLDRVAVLEGDTQVVPVGVGTYASRSAVAAGNAVAEAAQEVRTKLLAAAAHVLETTPGDLVIEAGQIAIRGVPGTAVSIGQVVQACLPTFASAGPGPAGFEATAYHRPPTVTYSSAVHVAQVEVDPETGTVQLLDYVVAHDCGRVINPIIVDGQIHGGVAQGIGGGLFEELVYDQAGQLVTSSFLDYLVPTAMEVPPLKLVHLEYPSPRNPLGIKGLGEGGAISPPAAIANAVEDALAPLGVRITETPLSPARLVGLIAAS